MRAVLKCLFGMHPVKEQLENLLKKMDGQTYRAGETIFAAGDTGDCIYVIRNGEIEIRFNGAVLEDLGPSDIFGEMALIDHEPRSATAIAKTECTVSVLREREFLLMVDEVPYFALNVMRTLTRRLRLMNDHATAQ